MHPRNIFKDCRPNFEELAEEFPEFQPFVYKGAAGKPYVDFQDPASLKALSTVLLKKHFDIVMEVPLDRLIPTVPLRLNYLHWIEDLLIDVDGGGGGDGKAKIHSYILLFRRFCPLGITQTPDSVNFQ